MSDLESLLGSFRDQPSPPHIDDDILKKVEHVLLFSTRNEIEKFSYESLDLIIRYEQSLFDDDSDENNIQCRVFKLIRFFPPDLLQEDQINNVKYFAFQIVQQRRGKLQQMAFSLIVDYLTAIPIPDSEYILSIIDWIFTYLENVFIPDIDMATLVISNLISFYLIKDQQIISIIPSSIDKLFALLQLYLQCLTDPRFFNGMELIVAKIISTIIKLYELDSPIKQEHIQIIINLMDCIPKEVRYSHIFLNFLLLVSYILRMDVQQKRNSESKIVEYIKTNVIENIPQFSHQPFNKMKRVSTLTMYTAEWMLKTNIELKDVMQIFWPFMTIPHINRHYLQIAKKIIIDKFVASPKDEYVSAYILEQIIGCLDTLRSDLNSADDDRPFESDSWFDANLASMQLFLTVITKDPPQTATEGILSVMDRLTDYVSMLADMIDSTWNQIEYDQRLTSLFLKKRPYRDFREKITNLIDQYVSIYNIDAIPVQVKKIFLSHNLIKLMPSKQFHYFHKTLYKKFSQIQSISTQYHLIFFSNLSKHFDRLFMPSPLVVMLDLTRFVFQEAFSSEARANELSQNQQMGEDLTTFIWKILSCRRSVMVELLLTLFQLLFPANKPSRVPQFDAQIKRTPEIVIAILRNIADDPSLKVLTGLLALFLYPSCAIGTELTDSWTALFLPALESDIHVLAAFRSLFEDTSKMFPSWVEKLYKPTQLRLVTALISSFTKLNQKDICYTRSLLGRIPDVTANLSTILHDTKKRKVLVNIDGFDIYADAIFTALKRRTPDENDLKLLERVYGEIIKNLKFFEALNNALLMDIISFLHNNKSNFLNTDYEMPALYAHIFVKAKFGQVDISKIEDIPDFCGHLSMLTSNQALGATAVHLIHECLPHIPLDKAFPKIVIALVHGSQYAYKEVHKIFDDFVFTKDYSEDNNHIARMITAKLSSCAANHNRLVRKTVLYGMRYFEINWNMVTSNSDNRQKLLNDLPQTISKGYYAPRLEFVFIRPLSDIKDPVIRINHYLTTIANIKFQTLPAEIIPLFKNVMYQEKELVQMCAIRFLLQVIAALFPHCPEGRQTTVLYERVFALLKDDRLNPFAINFLKHLRKEKIHSLPTEIHSYFGGQVKIPQIPAREADLAIVEFALSHVQTRGSTDIILWIATAVKQAAGGSTQNEKIIYKIAKLTKTLDMMSIDITLIFQALIETGVTNLISDDSVEIPLYLMAEQFPQRFLLYFVTTLLKGFRRPYFYALLQTSIDKRCPNFVNFIIGKVDDHFAQLMAYVSNLQDNYNNHLINTSLACFKNAFPYLDSIDMIPTFRAFIKITNFISYSPTSSNAITHVFFCDKVITKYSGSVLQVFATEVLPCVKEHPEMFCHECVLRQIGYFFSKIQNQDAKDLIAHVIDVPVLTSPYKYQFWIQLMEVRAHFLKGVLEMEVDEKLSTFNGLIAAAAICNANINNKQFNIGKSAPLYPLTTYSIAMNIKNRIGYAGEAPTFKRLIYAVRLLPKYQEPIEGLTEAVCDKLDVEPMVARSSHLAFIAIGQYHKLFDFNDHRIIYYIIAWIKTNLLQKWIKVDKSEVYWMPFILQQIPTSFDGFAKCALNLIIDVLRPLNQQKEPISIMQLYPQLIEALVAECPEYLKASDVEFLKIRLFEEAPKRINFVEMKTMLQLIAAIPELLLTNKTDFPAILAPKEFVQAAFQKDVALAYSNAVKACIRVIGQSISGRILQKFYSYLIEQKERVSKPLSSPIATAAKWTWELGNQHRIIKNILVLLETFTSDDPRDFAVSLSQLRHPLNSSVLEYLRKTVIEKFEANPILYKTTPEISAIFSAQSDDVLNDLWKVKWTRLQKQSHLLTFFNLVAPPTISCLTNRMTEPDIIDIIAVMLPTMDDKVSRWTRYYCSLFPDTQLTKALWTSGAHASAPPLPYDSINKNIQFLDYKNLVEDALGLLKVYKPALKTAATFHQLTNYPAAHSAYLEAMEKNRDCYNFGLLELRRVSINLGLASNNTVFDHVFSVAENYTAKVKLPFFNNYSSSSDIKVIVQPQPYVPSQHTTFFSQTMLPFLTRTALAEEVYKSLQVLKYPSAPNMNMTELVKPWTVCWMKTLDKLTITISSTIWRLTLLNAMISKMGYPKPDPAMQTPLAALQDATYKNRAALARLLHKAGSTRGALKQLSMSLSADCGLNVTRITLPRIANYVATTTNAPARLKYSCAVLLRDFRTAQAMMTQSPLILQRWLVCILEIYRSFPMHIEPTPIFNKIAVELQSTTNERSDYYVTLALAIVRLNPEFVKPFVDAFLVNTKNDETMNIWLRWLPHIIRICGIPPVEFLSNLINRHTLHFVMSLRTIQYSKQPEAKYVEEIFQIIRKHPREHRLLADFEESLMWLKDVRPDIERLEASVMAHHCLIHYIDTGNLNIPEPLKVVIGGGEAEDLKKYCLENPPVFRSNVVLSKSLSFNGFKYTTINHKVIGVTLIADGKDEAMLRMTTVTGENRYFMLVSPRIFQFNQKEHMFAAVITKMIESHPSNVTRSKFIFTPYSFLLSDALLLVHLAPMTTMQFASKRPPLAEHLSMLLDAKFDQSPAGSRKKHKAEPTNEIRKWFLRGTEGSQMDYFTMRQSFASALAFYSVMRFVFNTPLPFIPSLCMFADRQKVALPGYFSSRGGQRSNVPTLPLTDSMKLLLPNYVLHGSFTTSWLSVLDALQKHSEKLRILLDALAPVAPDVEQRLAQIAPAVSEDTDKVGEVFPFSLLEHLIENSSNGLSIHASCAWI